MIWFFLMGMIAGIAVTILFIHRWVISHAEVIEIPPEENNEEETK